MKVLVVGTGAREHAIADALKDDVELYCYMSKINPGMSKIAEFKQGDEGEVEKVAEYAVENDIDIAFIGPEAPLGKGIVDTFKLIGKRITYGGETGHDQRIYYFNTKEIIDNKFGTANPVMFRIVDEKIGLDIDSSLRCSGVYSYKMIAISYPYVED